MAKNKKEVIMIKFNLLSIILILLSFSLVAFAQSNDDLHKRVENMHWTGQASWRIDTEKMKIYIDPLQLPVDSPKADLIFITHSHGDHLSVADIQKVANENTLLIGPKSCEEDLYTTEIKKIQLVNSGDTLTIENIPVEVVLAYNVKKKYHPKEKKFVGYILNIDGVKIYHSGDTDRIPEMKTFNCDVALLPLGQTYTMNSVQEAVDAVLDINPKIAIPMHYGMYEGKVEDAQKFKQLLEGKVEVIIK